MKRANLRPAAGIQTGLGVSIPTIASGSSVTIAVTFPQAYASPPWVGSTPRNSRLNASNTSVSATGFSATFSNWSPGSMPGTTFDWAAIPA